jgi:hypothetical protein
MLNLPANTQGSRVACPLPSQQSGKATVKPTGANHVSLCAKIKPIEEERTEQAPLKSNERSKNMDTAVGSVIAIIVSAAALGFGICWLVRSSSRYRGTRVVTCPETHKPALVEVDSLHATLTSTVGPPDIRLQDCSRWPIKEQCGQECLMDLDVAPERCLVSGVLMRWYRDKNCAYCGKAFSEIHWVDHRPALLSAAGNLVGWNDVSLSQLPAVLETHSPVCWDCYIAQDFRMNHPDLVVFRPWQNDNSGGVDGSSAPR